MHSQPTIPARRPSHRGAVNRSRKRDYYKVYVREDPKGGLHYKLLEVVKAIMPPKEEHRMRETEYGDRWWEYIDVYESKAEYKENVRLMKREGAKEIEGVVTWTDLMTSM